MRHFRPRAHAAKVAPYQSHQPSMTHSQPAVQRSAENQNVGLQTIRNSVRLSATFLPQNRSRNTPSLSGSTRAQQDSINQSKFIFQAMRNNYNIINVTALERLYQRSITLIKTGRLNKKTTQTLIHKKKRKETGAETNNSMCNSSASANTNTYTINSKSSIHIS